METYLTIEGLAEYLKLAEQTIRQRVHNREIPFHKIKKLSAFVYRKLKNVSTG